VITNLLQQIKTPPADVHAQTAMIYLTRNDFGEAKKELEAAFALKPNDPENPQPTSLVAGHLPGVLAA
jgi:Tfp pilus assembly protein PilF